MQRNPSNRTLVIEGRNGYQAYFTEDQERSLRNLYGMDIASTIAVAMEEYQRGRRDPQFLDYVDLIRGAERRPDGRFSLSPYESDIYNPFLDDRNTIGGF